MNKIAIVGHPTSGYLEVEALLHQCGMQSAQPSRREGLSPQDITATLCKAHKAPPLDTVVEEDEIPQIQAGPVWHGMALDLMLGNLEQELWGWADPQALYALDYWKDLDPKLTFVLVYDEPHRVLTDAGRPQGEPPTAQELRRRLDNWVAYNRALLRFYLRHPQRCLLVHSQQVRRALDSYLQQLQPLIDVPLLREPADAMPATLETERGDGLALPDTAAIPREWAVMVSAAGIDSQHAARVLSADALERRLIEDMLADHPVALHTYAELESAANLPRGGAPKAPRDAEAAWLAFVQQRALVWDLLGYAHAEQHRASDALDQLRKELDSVRQQAHAQLIHLTHTSDKLEAERSRLEQALQAAQAQHSKLQAELDGVREQAQTQAQAVAEREQQAQELREENELLLNQLHQVQEELEHYYLENQQLKVKLPKPKPPGPYGAADRIKRQLSYRLGAVMIQRSRTVSGWVGMPWALWAEARAFRKERAASGHEKLPPIHTYRDAHEAERVKKHLSYRLGKTLIDCSKSPVGWVKLPFALHRQVREFRLERAGNGQ
jgi:hypothetical protein